MMKTLTAALTAFALVLTPASPALANEYEPQFNHEDAATAVFALLAFGVLAKALSNRGDDDDEDDDRFDTTHWQDRDAPRIGERSPGGLNRDHWRAPTVIGRDRGGLRHDDDAWWREDRRGDGYASIETRVLPSQCLRTVDTRYGEQLFFGRHCLTNRYAGYRHLPVRCEVQLYTGKATRHGYDPLCLRQQGYTTTRH